MKIIKKTSLKEFSSFRKEENSESVAFVETKQNCYFVRFDILKEFYDFIKEIKEKETFLCLYHPGETVLKTVDKREILELKSELKIEIKRLHDLVCHKFPFA